MLSTNIEAEFDKHLSKVKARLYDEFATRTEYEIARKSDGILPKKMENPIARGKVFFELIDSQYLFLLREAVDGVKALFNKHGLGFRLIDIHQCFHGYHRMTLLWTSEGKEYVFDFLFDSSRDDPFESFYRLGEIDGCGTAINGDILHADSRQLFSDNLDLPSWFTRGLQRNS